MYYNGNQINVFFRNDMDGLRGCVKKNDDDSYSIFINAKMGYQQQRETMRHELIHIESDDFAKSNIQSIEYHAHKEGKR